MNFLTLITEFIGMVAATAILGVPSWLTIIFAVVFLTILVASGTYWTFERITLLFCFLNLVYIPAAFLANPDWSQVGRSIVTPTYPMA